MCDPVTFCVNRKKVLDHLESVGCEITEEWIDDEYEGIVLNTANAATPAYLPDPSVQNDPEEIAIITAVAFYTSLKIDPPMWLVQYVGKYVADPARSHA